MIYDIHTEKRKILAHETHFELQQVQHALLFYILLKHNKIKGESFATSP